MLESIINSMSKSSKCCTYTKFLFQNTLINNTITCNTYLNILTLPSLHATARSPSRRNSSSLVVSVSVQQLVVGVGVVISSSQQPEGHHCMSRTDHTIIVSKAEIEESTRTSTEHVMTIHAKLSTFNINYKIQQWKYVQ